MERSGKDMGDYVQKLEGNGEKRERKRGLGNTRERGERGVRVWTIFF